MARLGSILTKETDMSKTKFGTFEGEIYYARVFAENMDNSELHVATQGQYNCVFVPKDDNELDKIIKMGYPEVVLGHKMVKEYDVAAGRKGIKLKRHNVHPKIADFGGPPQVLKDDLKTEWSMAEDGELGNGTKVKVKISIYGEGSRASVRLEKIAVMEHIPYVKDASVAVGW